MPDKTREELEEELIVADRELDRAVRAVERERDGRPGEPDPGGYHR